MAAQVPPARPIAAYAVRVREAIRSAYPPGQATVRVVDLEALLRDAGHTPETNDTPGALLPGRKVPGA